MTLRQQEPHHDLPDYDDAFSPRQQGILLHRGGGIRPEAVGSVDDDDGLTSCLRRQQDTVEFHQDDCDDAVVAQMPSHHLGQGGLPGGLSQEKDDDAGPEEEEKEGEVVDRGGLLSFPPRRAVSRRSPVALLPGDEGEGSDEEEGEVDLAEVLDFDFSRLFRLPSAKRKEFFRVLNDELVKNPSDTQLLMKRAQLSRRYISSDAAIRDYTEVIRLDPQNAEAFLERGGIYFWWKKQYDLGIQDYTEYIRLRPKDPKGYKYRAEVFAFRKEYFLAIQDCSKALRLAPDRDLLLRRAQLYIEVGRFDSASRDVSGFQKIERVFTWTKTHRYEPYDARRALQTRGEVQYYSRRDADFGLADFLEDLRQADEYDINTAFPHLRVAMALLHLNRFVECMRHIQVAISRVVEADETSFLRLFKSFVLARMGRWQDAGKVLVRAVDVVSDLSDRSPFLEKELRFFPDSVATLRDVVFAMPSSPARVSYVSLVQKYYSPSPAAATHVGLAPRSLRSVLATSSGDPILGAIELFEEDSDGEDADPLRAVDEAEAVLQKLDDKKERRQLKRALLLLLSQSGLGVRLLRRTRTSDRCSLTKQAWEVVTHSCVLGESRWSSLFDHSRDHCFCMSCLRSRGEDPMTTVRTTNGARHGIPIGWTEFGVSVSEFALARGCLSDWHVAFHGTTIPNAAAIMRSGGDLLMPGDLTFTGKRLGVEKGHIKPEDHREHAERLYVTKSVLYALKYSKTCRSDGRMYKVMLRVRIAPGTYKEIPETLKGTHSQIDPDFKNSELEWTTGRRSAIYVVGLLVRKL